MIQVIGTEQTEAALDFARTFAQDAVFSAPMLQSGTQYREHLLAALSQSGGRRAYGAYDGTRLVGLFCFVILPQEQYLEMLVGLSRDADAYAQMLSRLREEFAGWRADFVFNPANILADAALRECFASFDPVQVKYLSPAASVAAPARDSVSSTFPAAVVPYTEAYREAYCALHDDTDRYWTAEKVLSEPALLCVLLALCNGAAVGYIECARVGNEEEIYDLFVIPHVRRNGIGRALLAAAAAQTDGRRLFALVGQDNAAARALFRAAGFSEDAQGASVTATLLL